MKIVLKSLILLSPLFLLVNCSTGHKINSKIDFYKNHTNLANQVDDPAVEGQKEIILFFGYNYPTNQKLSRVARIEIETAKHTDNFIILNKLQEEARKLDGDAIIEIRKKDSTNDDVNTLEEFFDDLNRNAGSKVIEGVIVKYQD